jgi:predicted metal-dependent HD superfamily phosphohydrolase
MRYKTSPAVSSSGSNSISDNNSARKPTSVFTYGLNHSFNAPFKHYHCSAPIRAMLAAQEGP